MSQQNEIGNASIGVSADISGVVSAIEEARGEIESLGPTTDNSSQSIKKSIDRVENELDKLLKKLKQVKSETNSVTDFTKKGWGESQESISPFIGSLDQVAIKSKSASKGLFSSAAGAKKFITSMSSSVGVITAATGAVTGLAGVLLILKRRHDQNEESIKRQSRAYMSLVESVQSFGSESVESVDKLNKSYDDLLRTIDSQNGVVERSRLDALAAQAQSFRLNNLEKAQQLDLRKAYQDRAAVDIEARTKQMNAAKELIDLVEDQEISMLPDSEQIAAQADKAKRVIEERFRSLNVLISEEDLRVALENIDKIAQKKLDDLRKIEDEKDRLAKERADKELARNIENAKKLAEVFAREMQAATDGLIGSTSQFTTSLKGLLNEVKKINSNVGNLK